MHQLYFTKKHRRFFPPGQHRKIESTNTASEKSADRSGKYYEALHTFISKKPSLLPRGGGKKRTRSLSEQHSAVSQARHVAQYWNMREVKVCKYHLIAESCSRLVHRVRNRRPFYRGCIERGRSRDCKLLANPKTCDIPGYIETILGSFRSFCAWRGWTTERLRVRRVLKVLTLFCGGLSKAEWVLW